MSARQAWERAESAREALGGHLDEVERRFAPGHLMKVSGFVLRRSFTRHPVGWRVVGASIAAILLGLLVWAIVADDEDDTA